MFDFERVIEALEAPTAAPLHARLREAIQTQLKDGTLKPGESLPPERALREKLGISRATIRQAIKSLIDEGKLKSVVGAGTFVLEPTATPSHNPLIGIIVPESNYSIYYPELVSSLSFDLRNAGFRVDTSIHNDRYETLSQVTSSLLSQQAVAMAIVAPNQVGTAEIIRKLQADGVIVILLTRYLNDFNDIDYIGADNQLMGTEATQHLIELGHTGIVHIAASKTSTAFDRATGYVQAMKKAGLTPRIFIAPDEQSPLSPELMEYVMKPNPAQLWIQVTQKEITGIFSFNDQMASWVQKEIRKLNLSIPRDVSLISIDNMPYAGFFDAPLTTYALPGEQFGKQAADLLLRRISGLSFPAQRILLPAELIQRLSTAPPNNSSTLSS